MFSSCYQLVRRAAKGMLAGNRAVFHQDFSDGTPGNISILMNQQSLVGDGLEGLTSSTQERCDPHTRQVSANPCPPSKIHQIHPPPEASP